MTKLGISVGILATVFCLSVSAQTINVMTLDQAGAQTVLQAARERAQQCNAPSAIAVVDPAGDLLAFQRMDGVRPASAELAIEKARTAARLQRPTEEIEDNINRGRTAFVTVGIAALRERFDVVMQACKTLGFTQLFMPSVPPEERQSPEPYWTFLGRELGQMAWRARDKGIELGYHNHN